MIHIVFKHFPTTHVFCKQETETYNFFLKYKLYLRMTLAIIILCNNVHVTDNMHNVNSTKTIEK